MTKNGESEWASCPKNELVRIAANVVLPGSRQKGILLDMIESDFLFFHPRHHLEQSSSGDVL